MFLGEKSFYEQYKDDYNAQEHIDLRSSPYSVAKFSEFWNDFFDHVKIRQYKQVINFVY